MAEARWRPEPGTGESRPTAMGAKRAYSAVTGSPAPYSSG